ALKIYLELRACLKTNLGFNPAEFGVSPSGGFRALPPEGGTPILGFQPGFKGAQHLRHHLTGCSL
ncbi:MAG: hypothetical protein ABIP71_13375, partial [Verrucomicrobiota bacterium]